MNIEDVIKTAATLDRVGLVHEAQLLDDVIVRVAQTDVNKQLGNIPGLSVYTDDQQQRQLQKSEGITEVPLQSYQGSGPENPLEMPEFKPGMSNEQMQSAWRNWYNNPQTRAWFSSDKQLQKKYWDYLQKIQKGIGGPSPAPASNPYTAPPAPVSV